jgi:hypothetical protein
MNNTSALTPQGLRLQEQLQKAREQSEAWEKHDEHASKINVAGVGKTISTAYEQLRNAAEYTEEHLLLQRAIRRFFRRNLSFYEKKATAHIDEELVIELTQSGYLINDSVPKQKLDEIETIITGYYDIFWQMRSHHVGVDKASEWTLDVLSVATEAVFNKTETLYMSSFADFAYNHYSETYDGELKKENDFETALYIAVHRTLLKSDRAVVRLALLQRQNSSFEDLKAYIRFNQRIDLLFQSPTTEKLTQNINKSGAPLRVLKRLIDEHPEIDTTLNDKIGFLGLFETQTQKEYKAIGTKINRGVLRSIAFLFITKVIVGLAIEVPYDIYFTGAIIVLPLVINLLFPPLFMSSLKLTMRLPGQANTTALRDYMDSLMYATDQPQYVLKARASSVGNSIILNTVYFAMFVVVFMAVILQLRAWHFEWLHIFIFFLFLSTASFLGFRLSRMIRELEMLTTHQSGIVVLRDFIYTPFVIVGRWISDKYSRVNIIALILDMAIELPLKTFLRLTRQWTRFLSDKNDRL